MKKYGAFIFDLDGTLMNTLGDLTDATNHILSVHGFPVRTEAEVRTFVGNGARNQLRGALPKEVSEEELDRLVTEYKAYYACHCDIRTCPYEGTAELLTALKSRGVPMAIVTNKPDEAAQVLCKKWFGEWINVVVGEKAGTPRKPAGDMVHIALRKLGVDPGCAVYVGDSEVDLATARNSGLDCISCLWGFRNRDLLESLGADKLVETPEEILSYVE